MRESFERCGMIDDETNEKIDVEYDISKPCHAIDELMKGYMKWVDRYISLCNGQENKSHQEIRLEKWNSMLDIGKRLNLKLIGN